eukprot:COSAG01_NODE_60093_length_296_cov_1.203046_2_plen_24_part_01
MDRFQDGNARLTVVGVVVVAAAAA